MPRFTRACLDRIYQQVSIADVVAPYVQLKPSGHYLKGFSPFNNEKTPSFFVDPQKNIFKCFSSGYAGNIFRFLELKEQLSFPEAVLWIAEKFNIQLEYESGGQPTPESSGGSHKKVLLDIYAQTESFFKKYFWASDENGQKVRNYWQKERQFKDETAQNFGIGFAPTDRFALYKNLRQAGYKHEALAASGLFYTSKDTLERPLVCRYQGRLIIPIKDIQGRTIAFSGRQLPFFNNPDDPTREAKYINSPETPIFIKGQQLFNMHQARQAANTHKTPFFLVEGPLDVIRCWEGGLQTVVAPQGTGLTETQMALLKRYGLPVIGMFDGDSAGIKAGIRFIQFGWALNLQIRYLLLEPGADPDTAFRDQSCQYKILEQQLLDPVSFVIEAFRRLESDSHQAERKAIDFVYESLSKSSSALLKYESLRALSGELGVPLSVLESDFKTFNARQTHSSEEIKEKPNIRSEHALESVEGQLLNFLFQYPEYASPILQTISFDWIDTELPEGHLLFEVLNDLQENGLVSLNASKLEQLSLTASEKNLGYQILAEIFEIEDDKKFLVTILEQLYKKFLKKRISTIDKEMVKDSNNNADRMKQLHVERYELKKALADAHLEPFDK